MKKFKPMATILSVGIIIATALLSKTIESNQIDSYYYKTNIERYEQLLDKTINTFEQTRLFIHDGDASNPFSMYIEISECKTNIREVALCVDTFESGINRAQGKIIYSLNPIKEHLAKYNTILDDEVDSNNGDATLQKITEDLILIRDSHIFSTKHNSYKDFKQNWETTSKKLNYKPDSLL